MNGPGQQRTGQGKVGSQGNAREHANHHKPGNIAAAQLRRKNENRHGQQHAQTPGPGQADATHQLEPQRNSQRRAQKIATQKQGLAGLRRLQAVLHKKKYQGGRHRAGNAVDDKHRQ